MDDFDDRPRFVTRTAWLPTRLDDGAWVWLVRYNAREVFEPDYGGVSTGLWLTTARWRHGEVTRKLS